MSDCDACDLGLPRMTLCMGLNWIVEIVIGVLLAVRYRSTSEVSYLQIKERATD